MRQPANVSRIADTPAVQLGIRTGRRGGEGLVEPVTSLRFLTRFTSQDDADCLTPSRPATWLRSVAYTGRKDPAALHAHLTAAAPGVTGPAGAAAAAVTRAFVAALTAIVAQIHPLDVHIAALLREHADAHIFLSLPRVRCARLGCWPRSGTAAPGSPPRNPSPRWPVSPRPRGSPGR
ncbi:hypothetical protein [Pseudonocardia sp. T1-2H]|uniref:hypothetical protein n=1 Tax=Pseudonocardia sp. T1-2H TaxID=3128899 RepID=UPI003100DEE2